MERSDSSACTLSANYIQIRLTARGLSSSVTSLYRCYGKTLFTIFWYIVFFVLLTSEELFEKALTMFGLLLFFCITSTSNSDKKGQRFSLLTQLTLSYYFLVILPRGG